MPSTNVVEVVARGPALSSLRRSPQGLSLKGIMRMTDDEAHGRFQAIRWADNGGEPFCPRCECTRADSR